MAPPHALPLPLPTPPSGCATAAGARCAPGSDAARLRKSAGTAAGAKAAVVPDERLAIGGLQIDVARREVRSGERVIELTAKEFDLLLHFARSPGRVMTRLQLLQAVWGYGHSGYEHTVNTHINRLRAKIEADPNRPDIIQTVWGVGYRGCDARERSTPRATPA